MSSTPLQVAYCGNDKVFPLILLSALSAARHTEVPILFHIVTMDLSDLNPRYTPITEAQRAILEEGVQAWNSQSRVVLHDGREHYFRLLHGKNTKNSYTPYAMGRLLLPQFGLEGRVIYFDSDVMVRRSLTAFDEIALDGYEFAAVLDHMGKFWIRSDYCNSGVMLINLGRVRETGLFGRACERIRRRRMAFPDQAALNALVVDKLILPRRFNEQRDIREDTVVKHFCRGIKWLPFFKVYNYKQNEVDKVHGKLGITCFDDVYADYDRLAEKYGLAPLKR